MKKEDYEKEIKELNEKALKLEKTMKTYRDLEKAKRDGHVFETYVHSYEFGEIEEIQIFCKVSGAYCIVKPKQPMELEFLNNPKFGDLAGKKLKDIEIDIDQPSQETTEIDEKPTLPLESSLDPDGTYKVDVSSIINKRKQEE